MNRKGGRSPGFLVLQKLGLHEAVASCVVCLSATLHEPSHGQGPYPCFLYTHPVGFAFSPPFCFCL